MRKKCKLIYFGILIIGILCWIIVSKKLGFAADSTKILDANNAKKDITLIDSVFDNDTSLHAISRTQPKSVDTDCINVNTASNNQLISLHGIGPVLAERIVDYRKKNGKFKNASELTEVKGIGKGKLERIKNCICF